jgi:DNA-binding transcriptional regulator YdaS (Cro superfamily)
MPKAKPIPQGCPIAGWFDADEGNTQGRLAELTGLSPPQISNFALHRRSMRSENIRALSLATGVSADRLLAWCHPELKKKKAGAGASKARAAGGAR